jgi:hypothetical protein
VVAAASVVGVSAASAVVGVRRRLRPAIRSRCGRTRGGAVGHEALQDRQRERRRLAGAGARAAEQVAPLEQERNRLRLDRRRVRVALLADGALQRLDQREVGEADGRSVGGEGGRRIGELDVAVCIMVWRVVRRVARAGAPGRRSKNRRTMELRTRSNSVFLGLEVTGRNFVRARQEEALRP